MYHRGVIARNAVVVISVAAAMLACKKKDEGPAHRASATDDTASNRRPPTEPLGPVVGEHAGMRLAVYYLDAPRTPPRAELDRLLAGEPAPRVVTDIATKPSLPFVLYAEPTIAEYAPPDAKSLPYFSRGLSDAEAAALPESTSVVAIGFFTKSSDALPQLRRAHAVAAALAAATGGLVWSDDVRVAFGAKAWEARGHALDGDTPDIEPLVTIHAYQADPKAGVRLVSLGLQQLGLPDLVIEDVPGALGEGATFTIDLVAQLLAEGAQPAADGRFALSLAEVKNKAARERLQARVEKGGVGKDEILLVLGDPDEGDADNRLWRIEFYGDGTYHERMARTFAALFGRVDEKVGTPILEERQR